MAMNHATDLYAALPRNRRGELYTRVMANPAFPFHDGPNDSPAGRYFIIATGAAPTPASHNTLDVIVVALAQNEGYNQAQVTTMYQVYRDEITALLAGAPMPAPLAAPPLPALPSTAAAPHRGDLQADFLPKTNKARPENLLRIGANEIMAEDAIVASNFEDGDEVVVLERAAHGFKHVYKRASLDAWFNTNPPPKGPTTRKVLTQADIERYTLRIRREGGKRRQKSRKVRKSRLTRHRAAP